MRCAPRGENLKQMENKVFLTARGAANYLGFALSYLYKLTSSHKIPFYAPTGKHILFKRSELDEWVNNSRVATEEELITEVQTNIAKKGGKQW